MNGLPRFCAIVLAAALIWMGAAAARAASLPGHGAEAPPSPPPDARYKADALVIVAHPDDEMMVGTWLAKASFDDRKRIAVVFLTRGNAGGNLIGYEQGASLAAVREIEARRSLALLDIDLVWFLDAPDTPAPDGHDVLRSLAAWDHGTRLAELVRFIRLTRPAVVVSMLPDVVVGENHEDHQAAGVIATEAFDLAGDPTWFPEQVAFPADRRGFAQLQEGLQPWQPQKLYYFSDADDQAFLDGRGPAYPVKALSPRTRRAYFRYWLAMAREHATQYEGKPPPDAPEPPDFDPPPRRFALGKSLVGGTATDDIFAATGALAIPFARTPGYQPDASASLSLHLGGPWYFYRQFWQAHGLGEIARLQPLPVAGMSAGGTLAVPLLLRNDTEAEALIAIRVDAPAGWTIAQAHARYPVPAHGVYPVKVMLTASPAPFAGSHTVRFAITAPGGTTQRVALKVMVR